MNGIEAVDVLKSFSEIMSPTDYTEFLKSEDSAKLRAFPEVQELLKGEMPEQFKKKEDKKEEKDEDDGEKPGDEKDDKEPDDDEDDKEEKEEKKKPWEKEKAITDELIKGLQDSLSAKDAQVGELRKSIDTLTDIVSKLAGMPISTKAVRSGNANFFEKSFGGESKDESGKRVLSVNTNKEVVLKSLEDGLSKADDSVLKSAYENSIIRYNAGGGTISQEVAVDLFENHGIRLTQ